MSNLTISVDDELVRRARIKAIEEGTSLSAKVRDFLASYAMGSTQPRFTPAPELPVFRGAGGLQPGVQAGSNKSLLAAADGHTPPAPAP
ncbi:MAG: hypothetical protein CVU30_07615 [Betaproteobacteria bacterium HGW-Betaproteobacteria-3]|jgi:hypothetical protein|nr:MAG: hypothetical protein CVU30_07615 [Betaproteobacteria bacterium HGW-Betaproteobacteria-3]